MGVQCTHLCKCINCKNGKPDSLSKRDPERDSSCELSTAKKETLVELQMLEAQAISKKSGKVRLIEEKKLRKLQTSLFASPNRELTGSVGRKLVFKGPNPKDLLQWKKHR